MKLFYFAVTLIFLGIAANATTIFIDSNALSTTNNSSHITVDLSGTLHPNSGWAAALSGSDWISYGPTGNSGDPGYFSPSDGTLVTFSLPFTLSGLIMGGRLKVLADDSTSVILNGHTLIAADTTPGSRCSNAPVGCRTSTEGIFTFGALSPYLVDGVNTFQFGVLQVSGSSFGLDFAGHVDTTPTPEPATFGVIGGALIALAALRRRK